MKKISSAVLAVLLPVVIFFIAGMACYSYELTREAVKTSAETAQAKLLEQADTLLEAYVNSQAQQVRGLETVFEKQLGINSARYDTTSQPSSIVVNGQLLNHNQALLDNFTSQFDGSIVATVMVKHGNDFQRVLTNVKDNNGISQIDSMLSRDSKAYYALSANKSLQSVVELYGKYYVVSYSPQSSGGVVQAATFVGSDIDSSVRGLVSALHESKIGKSGGIYVYVPSQSRYIGDTPPTDIQDWQITKRVVSNLGWELQSFEYEPELFARAHELILTFAALGISVPVIIGLLLVVTLKHLVSNPLERFQLVLQRVGRGDLRNLDDLGEYRYEIANLAGSLDKSLSTIGEQLRFTKEAAQSIGKAVSDTDRRLSDNFKASETQASDIANIAAAMTEMESTVAEVARNTELGFQNTKRMETQILDSTGLVSDTILGVDRAGGAISKTRTTMTELLAVANGISTVVELIGKIADQTNLLALNAAIEAARAGTHGRGFAVVADEVRTLAGQTLEATRSISETIKELKSATNSVDSSISAVELVITENQQCSQQLQIALEQVNTSVTEVHDMMSMIATSTQEQAAVAEDIAQNINRIRASVDQSVNDLQLVAKASTNLGSVSSGMLDSLKPFVTN